MDRITLASVALMLACPIGIELAHADVYTWVDAKGTVTVSNLAPPEGSRVTSVTREAPQTAASRDDAAREARRQAEMQALADRVRQLESEVELARQPPPAPVAPSIAYVPVPTPMIIPVQTEAPAPARTCDPSWYGCWAWNAWSYPNIIVLPATRSRHAPALAHRVRDDVPVRRHDPGGRLRMP